MRAAGVNVLVVNDNYRIAPWANVLYSIDEHWWNHWIDDVREKFTGSCWSGYWNRGKNHEVKDNLDTNLAIRKYGLNAAYSIATAAFQSDLMTIAQGSNSGLQGVNLVYHFGAKLILLLGYDLDFKGSQVHWFGNHPKGFANMANIKMYAENFTKLNMPVPVINCSRRTVLECFPRMPIDQALELYLQT